MDVKIDFIHGGNHEDIYINYPKVLIYYTSLFFRFKKSLYGLKQVPGAWYAKTDNFLLSQGFEI